MNVPRFAGYLAMLTMGATLAGCSSGGSALAPTGGALGVDQVGALAPGHANRSNTFQYISNTHGGDVSILDYPKSDQQVGSIGVTGPWGECANVLYGVARKTFWVVAADANSIQKFKVGGSTPIKTLTISAGGPVACAIDPTTHDMAVTILTSGKVVIFEGGGGTGTVYSTPLAQAYYDGYDNAGNLFVNGSNGHTAVLVVLEKGRHNFKPVTVDNGSGISGNVQWDGKYLAVTDQDSQIIYRYKVRGTHLTLKSQVRLYGTRDCAGTWIGNGELVCPDTLNNAVYIFKYPAGGSAIATLTGYFNWPSGAIEVSR